MTQIINNAALKIAAKMREQYPDMPEHRAQRKSKNTVVGFVLLTMGCIGFLVGMLIMVLPFFVMKEHPGAWLLAFGALVVTFAFFFVTLGAKAMSDDVIDSDDAPGMIVAVGKAIGLARGKSLDG